VTIARARNAFLRGTLTLIAATLTSGVAATAQPDPAVIATAEKIVTTEAANHPQGSLTVAFVSASDVIWTRSYGYSDELAKTPATRNTVYRIGSVTKQFTGVMLLQLVEHREVGLSDPVEKYFPAIKTLICWAGLGNWAVR
jgi:CubicO group peptidase (beta-lactamase class C family)